MSAQRSASLATYARFASLGSEGKHGLDCASSRHAETDVAAGPYRKPEKRGMVCMADVPATRESAQMSPFRRSPVARKCIFVSPLRVAPGRTATDYCPADRGSNLSLFCHLERIHRPRCRGIALYFPISYDRAAAVPPAGFSCGGKSATLGSPHGVRPVCRVVKSDRPYPAMHQAGVLTRRKVWRPVNPARE